MQGFEQHRLFLKENEIDIKELPDKIQKSILEFNRVLHGTTLKKGSKNATIKEATKDKLEQLDEYIKDRLLDFLDEENGNGQESDIDGDGVIEDLKTDKEIEDLKKDKVKLKEDKEKLTTDKEKLTRDREKAELAFKRAEIKKRRLQNEKVETKIKKMTADEIILSKFMERGKKTATFDELRNAGFARLLGRDFLKIGENFILRKKYYRLIYVIKDLRTK